MVQEHKGWRTLGLIQNLGEQAFRGLQSGMQTARQREQDELQRRMFEEKLKQAEREFNLKKQRLPLEQMRSEAAKSQAETAAGSLADRPIAREHKEKMAKFGVGKMVSSKALTPSAAAEAMAAYGAGDIPALKAAEESGFERSVKHAGEKVAAGAQARQQYPTPTARSRDQDLILRDYYMKALERLDREERKLRAKPEVEVGGFGKTVLSEIAAKRAELEAQLQGLGAELPGARVPPSPVGTPPIPSATQIAPQQTVQQGVQMVAGMNETQAANTLNAAGYSLEQIAEILEMAGIGE